MNTQHLQYLIEIERTRSVSQAAENLFIGQPNLSRILHEMEANLGFKIFERTSKGVRSTERGAIFLQHAKSIIRELERIDALGPRHPVENRLRICIPRAAFILDLTADYLNTLPVDQNLDSVVRECHARQAIEMLENGEVEVGIIRFRSEYRDYFEEQSVEVVEQVGRRIAVFRHEDVRTARPDDQGSGIDREGPADHIAQEHGPPRRIVRTTHCTERLRSGDQLQDIRFISGTHIPPS